MSTEVTLPALGESVTEGTVSRWLKAVGDTVEADEPLLEVSTDKVDTEVPSPASGTLLEIKVPEDEDAEVGAVLAIIGDPSTAESAPEPAEKAEPEPVKSKAEKAPAPAPAAPKPPEAPMPTGTNEVAPRATNPSSDVYVTPLVRKLAKENNVDLSTITGTGVGGRIRKQDVLAAAKSEEAPAPAPAPSATPAPASPKPTGSARK
ncbi:2-oxoglutarate dehydrogenase, E2 component, dihydrolipoamide succinyltransferase, partial [Cutibacterium avidum TM16]|uniref:biotin/lipoyl-containing protein n=1 Tax=Cutibacterium avidum TaxID=33010 RepID=UPI00039145CC